MSAPQIITPAIVFIQEPSSSSSPPPPTLTPTTIFVNKSTNKKRRRSCSADEANIRSNNQPYYKQQQQTSMILSLSCTILNDTRGDTLKPPQKQQPIQLPTKTTLAVPGGGLLKLPSSNSASKQSLNCLNTPAGSIYDVSDTNSMVFRNNDFDDDNEEVDETATTLDSTSAQLSKLKLSQLDEQVATNFKLKCKSWLQNLINTPTPT